MSLNIIAKIIMLPSGDLHIALDNKESVRATVNSINELLLNTSTFVNGGYEDYISSTTEIYPQNDSEVNINELPALTLCDIYQDHKHDIWFPVIYHILKNQLDGKLNNPINLRTYIKDNRAFDPTIVLLHIYMASIDNLFPNVYHHFDLSRNEERIRRTITEIIRTIRVLSHRYKLKPDPPISKRKKAQVNLDSEESVITKPTNPSEMPSKAKTATSRGRKKQEKVLKELEGSTHHTVQNILKKNYQFSDDVRMYIRSVEEAQYYKLRGYKEVCWDGFYYLITDVSLGYFCVSQGKTNREIIEADCAPVVPGNEKNIYHVHHVGQHKKSPLAIIPREDHDIKYYSLFHDTKAKSEDLHTSSFTVAKRAFWKMYIKMYDKYKGFENIPSVQDEKKRR